MIAVKQAEPRPLEALRLPELLRLVCRHAGWAEPTSSPCGERFVVRCGCEPPDFLARLLEEALVEDEAEVVVRAEGGAPDYGDLPAGQVAVWSGFDGPCPLADELKRAAEPVGGRALLFAFERRDAAGRLLGVTWVAIPECEPAPQEAFRAAVLHCDGVGPAGGVRP
jgi:hypothetical protein